MFGHLRPLIAGSEHCIFYSHQFLESIKHTSIAPDECMVSLNVVLLFTCTPLQLACEAITNILDDFHLNLAPTAATEMLEHSLSNYIQFGNCYHQQVKVALMGFPIFGLIAEAVLQRLKRLVFAVITPEFWRRHVDDTFSVIKKDQVSSFHQLLSTTLPEIEFIMEAPTNDR